MESTLSGAGQALLDPTRELLNSITTYLPGLLAALLIIVLGYLVGVAVGFAVRKGIDKSKLQKWLLKLGKAESFGGIEISRFLGFLVKWWVFIAFLSPAAELVSLPALSSMLKTLALWLPHLLAGVIIMTVGYFLACYASDKILAAKKVKGIQLVGSIVKIIILVFFLSIALKEIGIKIMLAETTLLIIVAGITLAVAIAIGISFGFGMRKQAERISNSIFKKI